MMIVSGAIVIEALVEQEPRALRATQVYGWTIK